MCDDERGAGRAGSSSRSVRGRGGPRERLLLVLRGAAAALRLARSIRSGIALSVALAVVTAWLGLALAYWTDWPTSFWTTAFGSLFYLLANLATGRWSPLAS